MIFLCFFFDICNFGQNIASTMSQISEKMIDALMISIRECPSCDVEDVVKDIPGYLHAIKQEYKRIQSENDDFKAEIKALEAQLAMLEEKGVKQEEQESNIISLAANY